MANNVKNKINQQRNNPQFNPQIFVNEPEDGDSNEPPRPQQIPTSVPEENANRSDRYMELFHVCKSAKYATFLFIVWFMGIGTSIA